LPIENQPPGKSIYLARLLLLAPCVKLLTHILH
jgi:hypothetical protein